MRFFITLKNLPLVPFQILEIAFVPFGVAVGALHFEQNQRQFLTCPKKVAVPLSSLNLSPAEVAVEFDVKFEVDFAV